jgi:hypothetical protein
MDGGGWSGGPDAKREAFVADRVDGEGEEGFVGRGREGAEHKVVVAAGEDILVEHDLRRDVAAKVLRVDAVPHEIGLLGQELAVVDVVADLNGQILEAGLAVAHELGLERQHLGPQRLHAAEHIAAHHGDRHENTRTRQARRVVVGTYVVSLSSAWRTKGSERFRSQA